MTKGEVGRTAPNGVVDGICGRLQSVHRLDVELVIAE
jgi:hypothetical protein